MEDADEKLLRAQVKGELRRMHREGLIERVGFGEDGESVYRITDAGRAIAKPRTPEGTES